MGNDIRNYVRPPQCKKDVHHRNIYLSDIAELHILYAPGGFDVITCDISPNLSGIREVDNRNVGELFVAVENVVEKTLKVGGHLILKAFFSDDFKIIKSKLANLFRTVSTFKPVASRSASSEIYLVAVEKT